MITLFKASWKKSFFITLFFFVFSNLFWLYQIIDQGITTTHQKEGYEFDLRDYRHLATIYPKGESKKDFLFRLRKEFPKALLVDKSNYIIMDGLKFIFKEQKLFEIKTSCQYGCE